MPKAARARVASPPAGTALARATRDCLPGRVQLGRDSEVYVSNTVTNVNNTVTNILTRFPDAAQRKSASTRVNALLPVRRSHLRVTVHAPVVTRSDRVMPRLAPGVQRTPFCERLWTCMTRSRSRAKSSTFCRQRKQPGGENGRATP